MRDKQIDKILGRANGLEKISKDSDGDGVVNGLDCKPYDKNKQGVIHNIGERFKEARIASSQKRVAQKQIRSKARAAYYREKEEQDIRVAKEKAKIDADKKIKYHKQGGFMGQVSRGVSNIAKTTTRGVNAATKVSTSKKRTSKKRKRKQKTKTTSAPKSSYDIFGGSGFI